MKPHYFRMRLLSKSLTRSIFFKDSEVKIWLLKEPCVWYMFSNKDFLQTLKKVYLNAYSVCKIHTFYRQHIKILKKSEGFDMKYHSQFMSGLSNWMVLTFFYLSEGSTVKVIGSDWWCSFVNIDLMCELQCHTIFGSSFFFNLLQCNLQLFPHTIKKRFIEGL